MTTGGAQPQRPLATWESTMLDDLNVFLDGQPFCVDSKHALHFTPGGDLGSSLHVALKALIERDSYFLQITLSKETEGGTFQPLSARDLSIAVAPKDEPTAEAIEPTLERSDTLKIGPLKIDGQYRFFFASSVPALLPKTPPQLEAFAHVALPDGRKT